MKISLALDRYADTETHKRNRRGHSLTAASTPRACGLVEGAIALVHAGPRLRRAAGSVRGDPLRCRAPGSAL
jgi:hypothetical protein